jgi:hypothetical protein
MLSIAHHVPGRLRVKGPALKGAHNGADGIKEHLTARAGIQLIKVNRVAGSVVVHYDSTRVTAHELLAMLREVAPIDVVGPVDPLALPAQGNGTNIQGGVPVERTDDLQVATRAGEIFGKALASVFVKNVLEQAVVVLLTGLLTPGGSVGAPKTKLRV